ncbi:MAG: DUF3482 domain-containing protein [Ramlibacter sp.]
MSETQRFAVDEATARGVLLVRAIEEADSAQRLLEAGERERIEKAAFDSVSAGSPDERPAPLRYLAERARQILLAVGRRNPRVAALEVAGPWQGHLAWLLPLLAFISGLTLDRLGDPHKLDLLSPPLLAFIVWNVLVYGLLAASALPLGRHTTWADRATRWLGRLPSQLRELSGSGIRASLRTGFTAHWTRAAGTLESLRLQQVLHASAAAWAIGVALSIAAGGLVREYRVGWESLWLDAHGVQTVLNAVFAPVLWLLPVEGFTFEELQRLHSGAGVVVGLDQARKWVWLYLGLLLLVVVLPRALLAALARRRARALAQAVPLDLSEAYYADILARMNPVVAVGYVDAPTSMGELVRTVLEQASRAPANLLLAGTASTLLLRTHPGDELRAVPASAQAEVDQVWLCVATSAELAAAVPMLKAIGKPVLVLHAASAGADALRAIAAGAGLTADVAPIAGSVSCWTVEGPLWDLLLARLPPYKQERGRRLVRELKDAQQARLREAMHALGQALAQSAVEAQPLEADTSWRSRLPFGDAKARNRAREEAMAQVLVKVNGHVAQALEQLRQLHGLPALVANSQEGPWDSNAVETSAELLHPPNAAVAGAAAGMAAGALAGAKIDLLTGGLTMGAGAAVGALIGGSGAFGAARWFGETEVRLSDEQLLALARRLVVHYLAAIHARRLDADSVREPPEQWKAVTHALLADESKRYEKLWRTARSATGGEEPTVAIAQALRSTTVEVIDRLYRRA